MLANFRLAIIRNNQEICNIIPKMAEDKKDLSNFNITSTSYLN